METHTHCPTPPHPQRTTAKPHVSVGINRSAQSSSHPALKSFPEVVLQKPAAEEDKRTPIPQAQCLLSSTQLSLCCPPPSSSTTHLSPLSFHPSSFLSIFYFLSYNPLFLPGPSFNSRFVPPYPAPLRFCSYPFFHLLPSSWFFFFFWVLGGGGQTLVINNNIGRHISPFCHAPLASYPDAKGF